MTVAGPANAAVASTFVTSLSGTRIEGIGDGVDLLSSKPPPGDAIYPASMEGVWRCERSVVSVDGDAGQAEAAWMYLGGGSADAFSRQSTEVYETRFVKPPPGLEGRYREYDFDGEVMQGVVLDRGFEISMRARGTQVIWDKATPSALAYQRPGPEGGGGAGAPSNKVDLAVVQRAVDMPSAKGFGLNELVRVTTAAGGLFGGSATVQRACRVQRRFRRAFVDGEGTGRARVVEGLEIVKTYRVLDGVANALPTSSTKSTLRLTTP